MATSIRAIASRRETSARTTANRPQKQCSCQDGPSAEDQEFCYVHVPKTGGVSLIRHMSQYVDKNQSQNGPNFTRVRLASTGGWFTLIGHNSRIRRHITLARYKRDNNPNCFAFAFVRNPYDRVVSAFEYILSGGCNRADRMDKVKYLDRDVKDFDTFVRKILAENRNNILEQIHFKPQFGWISDESGKSLLDFVGRFESLEKDFNCISRIMGIERRRLPHLNKSRHRNYRAYYSRATKDIVKNAYQMDIDLFGYTF